jgi:transketolase
VRNVFCQALVAASSRPDFVFLTGDLGYRALEPLREVLGKRFLNAGVAEQNMVGVAAGLARSGLRPWVYSIAPFVYARPFEQIRNDLCLHRLPVVLVGNGGGYGYGVMGATHHALEDYGALLCLPHLRAYVPAFDADVPAAVGQLFEAEGPGYLRLGLSEEPPGTVIPPYAAWRKLVAGRTGVVVAAGALAGSLWGYCEHLGEEFRPSLWLVAELPLSRPPEDFIDDLQMTSRLLVVEEHVAQGGVGQALAALLLESGVVPRWFRRRTAQGYPSGRYGSQQYHRRECGLDPEAALAPLLELAQAEGVA